MKMQKLETHINCHVKMDQSLNEMRTCHGTALCILSTFWNKIVCIRCGEIAGLLLSVQMNCIPRETTYWNETKPQQKRTHESHTAHSVHILFPLYFSFSFETIYEIKESNFILLAVMSSNDDCLSNVKHSHHSFKCTIFSSSLIRFVWSDSFQESFNCVRVCVCTRNIKPDWQPHHHHHQ